MTNLSNADSAFEEKVPRLLGTQDSGMKTASADESQAEQQQSTTSTEFWNVNIPASQQTKGCPEYLRYAFENEKDRRILATPDDQYRRQSWDEVQRIVREDAYEDFMRTPLELRLYREYIAKIIQEHGSIMNFILRERLQWKDTTSAAPPFSESSEYKILYNDWPYGVNERIVHLVVWTKFILPGDPRSSMPPEIKGLVGDFVDRTFCSKCGKTNVVWFKNPTALKSVHAVEHIHVMLRNPDMGFVREITNGDVPLFLMAKQAKGII